VKLRNQLGKRPALDPVDARLVSLRTVA
jgi:hypothetical protein